MIVRAAQCLKAGEEITVPYTPDDQPYDERSNILSRWCFTCDCRLCVADRHDDPTAREERGRLHQRIKSIANKFLGLKLPVSIRQRNEILRQLRDVLASMEKTYRDTDDRRKCPIKPDLQQASALLSQIYYASHATPADDEENMAVEMQLLENAGIVIKDKRVRGPCMDMPLDMERTYCLSTLCRRCVMTCLRIASLAFQLRQFERAIAWVNAARKSE